MTQSISETAEQLIEAAAAAGADASDAIVMRSESTYVGVADSALEEAEGSEGIELGLRVLLGHRQACVASSNADLGTLSEMASRAVAIAQEAPEDPYCGLGEVAGFEMPDLELTDPVQDLDPTELEALALQAEASALAVPGVTQVEQASASTGFSQIALAASNGFSGSYGRTSRSISVSAIAGEGLGRERDWSSEARRYSSDLPPASEVGSLAGGRAVARLDPRKPPSGAFPVLYDRRVAPSLISHVLSAINGTSIARGSSWLLEAMGSQILPNGFDVIEDPRMLRGPSSRPFDAEGASTQRRALIENGVLQTWILDLSTARKLGLQSTGNARRGTGGPPSPGVTNVIVENGSLTREQLIRDMGTGLIVTSMIGSSINPTTGAYSRGASGFWVENGEVVHPVNEVTVAGSLPEMIKTLVRADDREVHRGISVPALLVDGVTVGA
ncbi:MAG: TldD/PmbA family protein [Pseudomonadota bacterium]